MKRRNEDFRELLRLWGEKAYNFAYRLSGNEHDAQDLMQEAFMKAYEHFSSYDRNRPFDSWLLRILHNIYLDSVRRYSHSHQVSLDAPSASQETPWEEMLPSREAGLEEPLLRREADVMVQAALNSVPLHYRTAVTLCDIEGLSYEEIGKIMDCPVGTVRSRIHQGRLLIRQAFEALEKEGKQQ